MSLKYKLLEKNSDFVLVEDTPQNIKERRKLDFIIDGIKSAIEKTGDRVSVYKAPVLAEAADSLIPWNRYNSIATVGACGEKALNLLNGSKAGKKIVTLPITRKWEDDNLLGFWNYKENKPWKETKNCLEDMQEPILVIDDWIASGSTLNELKQNKKADVSALGSDFCNDYLKCSRAQALDVNGYENVFVGLLARKDDGTKVRVYTAESLFEKSLSNKVYRDLFVKKRCGGNGYAEELIVEGGRLLAASRMEVLT